MLITIKMVFWTLSSIENFWHIKYVLGKGDKSVLIEMELSLWRKFGFDYTHFKYMYTHLIYRTGGELKKRTLQSVSICIPPKYSVRDTILFIIRWRKSF